MVKRDFMERLKLFAETAETALASRFVRALIANPKITFSLQFDRVGGVTTSFEGPDEDAVRAVILTFRMLVQEGDGISIDAVSTSLSDASVDSSLRDRFQKSLDELLRFLAEPLYIQFNGETYARGFLFDTMLYGHLAHLNPDKEKRVRIWKGSGPLFGILWNEFVTTLAEYLSCLSFLRGIVQSVIANRARSADASP